MYYFVVNTNRVINTMSLCVSVWGEKSDQVDVFVFFFKQKTAYEISACLVGSEMCIRAIAIPISILFVIMQKYYVEGVAGGSVKG